MQDHLWPSKHKRIQAEAQVGPSSPVSHTTMSATLHPHWVAVHGSVLPFSGAVLNSKPLLDSAIQPQHVFALAAQVPWGDFKTLKGVLFCVDPISCKGLPDAQQLSHQHWTVMRPVLGLISAAMGGEANFYYSEARLGVAPAHGVLFITTKHMVRPCMYKASAIYVACTMLTEHAPTSPALLQDGKWSEYCCRGLSTFAIGWHQGRQAWEVVDSQVASLKFTSSSDSSGPNFDVPLRHGDVYLGSMPLHSGDTGYKHQVGHGTCSKIDWQPHTHPHKLGPNWNVLPHIHALPCI